MNGDNGDNGHVKDGEIAEGFELATRPSHSVDMTAIFSNVRIRNLAPLFKAFAQAKQDIGPIVEDMTAKVGNFSYGYAKLSTVLKQINEAAHANGLLYVQNVSCFYDSNRPIINIERYLIHYDSGEMIVFSPYQARPEKVDLQGIGGAQTYSRRYCALSDWGMDDESDDDGNNASNKQATVTSNRQQSSNRSNGQASHRQTPQRATPPPPAAPAPAPAAPAAQKPAAPAPAPVAQKPAAPVVEHDPNDIVFTDGQTTVNVTLIEGRGIALYGDENWPRARDAAYSKWENERVDSGRAPTGVISDATNEEMVAFYSRLEAGLAKAEANAQAKKTAEPA